MIIQEARKYSNGDIVIAPQTSGVPGQDTSPQLQPATQTGLPNNERVMQTELNLSSTGVFNSKMQRVVKQVGPRLSLVYIIDTLDGTTNDLMNDSLKTSFDKYMGIRYLTRGHGSTIKRIITDKTYGIAPETKVIPVQACGSNGQCLVDSIVRGFCDAAQLASKDSARRVIVNASFSTPYDNPLIKMALEDAMAHGSELSPAYNKAVFERLQASGILAMPITDSEGARPQFGRSAPGCSDLTLPTAQPESCAVHVSGYPHKDRSAPRWAGEQECTEPVA